MSTSDKKPRLRVKAIHLQIGLSNSKSYISVEGPEKTTGGRVRYEIARDGDAGFMIYDHQLGIAHFAPMSMVKNVEFDILDASGRTRMEADAAIAAGEGVVADVA